MADTRILVVDDEPDLLELVSFNLSKAGYRVVCVKSGEAALAQIPVSPPDLLILDLLLPGVDGLDVCKALKRNPQTTSIPIIMLTARSEEVMLPKFNPILIQRTCETVRLSHNQTSPQSCT